MKLIAYSIVLLIFTNFTFAQEDLQSDSCIINYFTQKSTFQKKLKKLQPKPLFSKYKSETCTSEEKIIQDTRTVKEKAEVYFTVYMLKNSSKFKKN